MSKMNFDEYDTLFTGNNDQQKQQAFQHQQQQQQRERTHLYLQQQQQQQYQQQILQQQSQKSLDSNNSNNATKSQPIAISDNMSQNNYQGYPSYDNNPNMSNSNQHEPRSRFGSYTSSSSQFDSEVNFNELNDAVSSINSGILSPYSTGSSSSPDDFFLSSTSSNVDSQYSQDPNDYNVDLNQNPNLNNDILYPQQLVPVPMAESASNSTVTFNTAHDNYHNVQQNMAHLKTVDEVDEDFIKKDSPHSPQLPDDSSSENLQAGGGIKTGGRKVKSSHNLIEKKYRTNINSKIIELRNCVPALRILVAKNGNHRTRSTTNEVEETDDYYEGNGYSDDEEKLDGLKPAKKLNKATILSKASEYIRHLEKKNDILREQNYSLIKILESRGIRLDSLFQQPHPQHQQQPQFQQHPQFQQQQQQHHHHQTPQMYQDPNLHSSAFNDHSNNVSNANLVSLNDTSYNNINTHHLNQMHTQAHNQIPNQSPNPNQLMPDHQSLSNKLMMGNIHSVLGTPTLDTFAGASSNVNQK